MEVTDNGKHTLLLQFGINYSCRKFYDTGLCYAVDENCWVKLVDKNFFDTITKQSSLSKQYCDWIPSSCIPTDKIQMPKSRVTEPKLGMTLTRCFWTNKNPQISMNFKVKVTESLVTESQLTESVWLNSGVPTRFNSL